MAGTVVNGVPLALAIFGWILVVEIPYGVRPDLRIGRLKPFRDGSGMGGGSR